MSNGLTEEVVTGKQWYAMHTRSQHDKVVYQKLVRRNIAAFLPVTNVPCKGRGGKQTNRPVSLMPGYVFAQCDDDQIQSLKDRRIPDAKLLEGIVEDKCIKKLREQLEGVQKTGRVAIKGLPVSLVHKHVHITNGPFADFGGLVLRENRTHGTATVELQIWGQIVPTEVPLQHLEEIMV